MRAVIELVLVAALIALAWEKSLPDRLHELPWIGDKLTTSQDHPQSHARNASAPATLSRNADGSILHPRPIVTPSPAFSVPGSWLWDPKHKSPLDPPSEKHPSPTPH